MERCPSSLPSGLAQHFRCLAQHLLSLDLGRRTPSFDACRRGALVRGAGEMLASHRGALVAQDRASPGATPSSTETAQPLARVCAGLWGARPRGGAHAVACSRSATLRRAGVHRYPASGWPTTRRMSRESVLCVDLGAMPWEATTSGITVLAQGRLWSRSNSGGAHRSGATHA